MREIRALFLEETPLIDLRAPVEFNRGAFPAAVNLPLLHDEERARVGVVHRQQGAEAALRTGQELVGGAVRRTRTLAWLDFARAHPGCRLYCFRGGQRSSIARSWLLEAGADVPRVEGGYKRLRGFLLAELERLPGYFDWLVLGGETGGGKTELLQEFAAGLDLEALANHRGSAFGGLAAPQPTPVNFENRLSIRLLHQEAAGRRLLLAEDESSLIGRLRIPEPLFAEMGKAGLVVLEAPLEERARRTFQDYIDRQWLARRNGLTNEAELAAAYAGFAESLQAALLRIRRRLGGLLYERARKLMLEATRTRAPEAHLAWIRLLLAEYYDPMYRHQLARKSARVLFRGARPAVLEYLLRALAERSPDGD